MKKQKNLQKKYDELEHKYMKTLGEKMDLEYELGSLKDSLEEEQTQRQEIKSLHESTRRLKHDMKNHLMVLNSYLSEENYEESKKYLSNVLNRLNQIYTYIETGNSLMNHIINEKLEQAKNKGIDVKAEIENLSFDVMESLDFSALLNNMLDNAIEACEDSDDGLLTIQIRKKRSYHSIEVKNSISKSVLYENPELDSTKKEANHGFGVKQIKQISEKYNGLCKFYEERNMFCVCVMIPSEE